MGKQNGRSISLVLWLLQSYFILLFLLLKIENFHIELSVQFVSKESVN